ncbi:MAG: hypothetical protein ACKOE6_00390 [Flammeovirgaceae bacterium]
MTIRHVTQKLKLVSLFVCLAFVLQYSYAQTNGQSYLLPSGIHFPQVLSVGQFKHEVAMSQVKLPFDWLETSIQAPLFHYRMNVGLPKKFLLESGFSTLFVANHLALGPRWCVERGRLAFNVGYDVAFAFGALNFLGFDSSMKSWINYPNFSLGYQVKDVRFTLKCEMSFVTSTSSKQGANEVVNDRNFYNGYTVALFVEQRLWGERVFTLGFKSSYSKFHFMGWPAFPTFNRFYYIPELYLGLML